VAKKSTKTKEEVENFKFVEADLESSKIIKINFDKVFNQDISYINSFDLSKKKTYWNPKKDTKELIIGSLNFVFERDPDNEIIFNYLQIKYNIDYHKDEYSLTQFKEDIVNILLTKKLKSIIENDYLEGYSLDIDKKKSTKYKDSLQFTNEHAKLLLKISMGIKFIIPLATQYLNKCGGQVKFESDINSNKDFMEVDYYLYDIFHIIFDLFEIYDFDENGTLIKITREIDLANKLTDSIRNRISATKYSDKIIWDKYENFGVTPESIVEPWLWKTATDIIPKFVIDRNVFTFLHVCWKFFITNMFRTNLPINFKPIDLKYEDQEGLTQFDKIDIVTARINESKLIINDLSIKLLIKQMERKHEINISEEKLEFYKEHFKLNKIQKKLLSIYYASYFNNSEVIFHCNKEQVIRMTVILVKILRNNQFKCLNKILMSSIDTELTEKKVLNKKILNKVLSSKKYQRLITVKYSCMSNRIEKIISELIATIADNSFQYMNFKQRKLISTEYDIEVIAEEIVRFIELIN